MKMRYMYFQGFKAPIQTQDYIFNSYCVAKENTTEQETVFKILYMKIHYKHIWHKQNIKVFNDQIIVVIKHTKRKWTIYCKLEQHFSRALSHFTMKVDLTVIYHTSYLNI